MRLSRLGLALVLGAGLVAGAANIVLLAIINSALGSLGSPSPTLVAAFAALCLLMPVTWFASQYLIFALNQQVLFDLRMHLARRILATPLRRLEEVGPGRLLATLTEDVGAISAALLDIPLLCLNGAIVLGCLAYFAYLSWPVLLGFLVVMGLGLASYQLPLVRATRHFGEGRRHFDAMVGHLRSLTDGTKELKLHRPRREAFLSRHLAASAQGYRRESLRGARIFAAATGWGRGVFFVVIGLVLFVLPGQSGLDRTAITGYVLGLLYLMNPIDIVLRVMPELSRAAVAIRQVESLGLSLAEEAPAEEAPARTGSSVAGMVGGAGAGKPGAAASAAAPPATDGWRRLELDGVLYSYPGEEGHTFTLGPLDLSLTPGELVFVAGGNGSGKTTLAKLLIGLYEPDAGEIRFDGAAVGAADREAFRQHFSVVFSDFHLFPSLPGLSAPDLEAAAGEYLRALQLAHKVQVREGALSTVDLSQGQRKRLALLTAYLEDRPIYLFDEWAADQDPFFKEVYYRQLLPGLKARGKTVVVISHDDRYYGEADRLIKLENGRLVDPLAPAAPSPAAPAASSSRTSA